MVEPQPSKLMMPVRSWSAALFGRAGHHRFCAMVGLYILVLIPRISRGRNRQPRTPGRFSESGERVCDRRITILPRVLRAERGSRTCVSGTRHELSGRCTPRRRPGEARAPQVMKVDLGAPQIRTSCPPCGIEGVSPEPSALGPPKERRSGISVKEQQPHSARPSFRSTRLPKTPPTRPVSSPFSQLIRRRSARPPLSWRRCQNRLRPRPPLPSTRLKRRLPRRTRLPLGAETAMVRRATWLRSLLRAKSIGGTVGMGLFSGIEPPFAKSWDLAAILLF